MAKQVATPEKSMAPALDKETLNAPPVLDGGKGNGAAAASLPAQPPERSALLDDGTDAEHDDAQLFRTQGTPEATGFGTADDGGVVPVQGIAAGSTKQVAPVAVEDDLSGMDITQLRTLASSYTSGLGDGVNSGLGQWATRIQAVDPVPWYGDAMGTAVEVGGKALGAGFKACITASGPGAIVVSAAMAYLIDRNLKDASGRIRAACQLQDGEMFKPSTINDLQWELSAVMNDTLRATDALMARQTNVADLAAYVRACQRVNTNAVMQKTLEGATRLWLAYAQSLEKVRDPVTHELEPDPKNLVDLKFTIQPSGDVRFISAHMTGMPEGIREKLEDTALCDLPFRAQSVGVGAGIVIAQDLNGMVSDKSKPYAAWSLSQIAKANAKDDTPNAGMWAIVETLQGTTLRALGLKLGGQ